jgi:uncharacterized membrane protein
MSSKNETLRIEMFSDGVFAIAITLLILEIKVPAIDAIHSADDLWKGLAHLWPSYFAFILSFGFILIAWVNHHMTFNFLEKSSPKLMFANGFLLLNIIFLPYPTALLAEYITSDYIQPAVVFYCFCYVLQNIAWTLLFIAIAKSKLLKNDQAVHAAYHQFRKFCRIGLVIYISITILAWWFPLPALVLNTLLWFLWLSLCLVPPKCRYQKKVHS